MTGPAVEPVAEGCVALARWTRVGVPPLSGRNCWPQGQVRLTLLRSHAVRSGVGADVIALARSAVKEIVARHALEEVAADAPRRMSSPPRALGRRSSRVQDARRRPAGRRAWSVTVAACQWETATRVSVIRMFVAVLPTDGMGRGWDRRSPCSFVISQRRRASSVARTTRAGAAGISCTAHAGDLGVGPRQACNCGSAPRREAGSCALPRAPLLRVAESSSAASPSGRESFVAAHVSSTRRATCSGRSSSSERRTVAAAAWRRRASGSPARSSRR